MKKAQSLIEYALILALVTLVAITALSLLGQKVNQAVNNTGDNIQNGANHASLQYCTSIGCQGFANGVCTGCGNGNNNQQNQQNQQNVQQ